MIQWLTKNSGLKLISLALAIGLWYYAVGEEGIEVTRSIPLEIKVKNPHMSIFQTSTRNVQVTFRAPRSLLSSLATQEMKAFHEIGSEAEKAGDYSFRLEAREIEPRTLQTRVIKIEPEVIQVSLDELIVQKLAVKPEFTGDPAFGYKINPEEIQLNPNAVLVEGPKAQLEKLDSIKTEKVDLVGRIRAFRRTVQVQLPQNLKLLSEPLIEVYVPIHEEYAEKNFEKMPVKVMEGPGQNRKVEISPAEISFTVKGSKKQVEELVAQKILLYADLAGLDNGEHEVPVQIMLPENMSLKDAKPLTVKVNIK